MSGGIDVFPAQQNRTAKNSSFSTTSTTSVAALSLTGSGILSEFQISQTGGTNVTHYYTVIVDGTTLFSSNAIINSISYSVDNFGNIVQNSGSLCHISFSKSLTINVYSSSSTSNLTCQFSYEQ